MALKSGALEKSDLKDTADLINYMLDPHRALRSTLHAPHAPPADLAPLLSLLRAIRTQLRHL